MTMTVIEIKERDSPSSLSRYLGGQCHLLIPHHDASIQSHTDTINIIRRRHASPQTRTAPDTHALAVSSSGNRRRRSLYCTVVRTNREGLNMPILSLPPPPTRHPTTSPPGRKTTKQQTTNNQSTNQPTNQRPIQQVLWIVREERFQPLFATPVAGTVVGPIAGVWSCAGCASSFGFPTLVQYTQ